MHVTNRPQPQPLNASGRVALMRALGDTPETVISLYQLRLGLCHAYVDGTPRAFRAALLDSQLSAPGEAMTFGADAPAIWGLLPLDPDWFAVNVAMSVAEELGSIIASQ